MQLLQLVQKILGLAESTDKALTTELTSLRAKITDLEGNATKAASAHADALKAKDEEITKLKGDATTAETKITDLTAEVEAQKKLATKVIANAGIAAEDLPAGDAGKGGSATGRNILEEFAAITDPRAAGAFYMEHAEEILKARAAKLTQK